MSNKMIDKIKSLMPFMENIKIYHDFNQINFTGNIDIKAFLAFINMPFIYEISKIDICRNGFEMPFIMPFVESDLTEDSHNEIIRILKGFISSTLLEINS